MAGPQEPPSTPPDVPDEFAEAYRVAYERALAAQSEQSHRRHEDRDDEPDGLPRRSGRLRIGTHRRPPSEESEGDEPEVPPRHPSAWFVLALLGLLVVLLLIGAYVVGRMFAGRVDSSPVHGDVSVAARLL